MTLSKPEKETEVIADAKPDQPSCARGEDAVAKGEDVVVLTGRPAAGEGMGVVRIRRGNVELGAVQPLREGKPILGELVRLHPRPETPLVCDVEVELDARPAERNEERAEEQAIERGRSGPAQVATDRYRENWDVIWQPKRLLS